MLYPLGRRVNDCYNTSAPGFRLLYTPNRYTTAVQYTLIARCTCQLYKDRCRAVFVSVYAICIYLCKADECISYIYIGKHVQRKQFCAQIVFLSLSLSRDLLLTILRPTQADLSSSRCLYVYYAS